MSELMQVPRHQILQDGKKGPFRCDNCTYARSNATRCTHSYIVKHYGPKIGPAWCCDFIERVGKLTALVRST